MIRWQHLLCKPSMIPPCHLGIQNLHIHWRYPSGSGIYSHMVRHFTAASPSAAKRSTVASVLFTVTSSRGHGNHVFTIMTLQHSPNSEIFIVPEQYISHSDGERHEGRCRRPWLSGIEGTKVLFAILRAPHDAAYCKPSMIEWFHLVPPEYYSTSTEMQNSAD